FDVIFNKEDSTLIEVKSISETEKEINGSNTNVLEIEVLLNESEKTLDIPINETWREDNPWLGFAPLLSGYPLIITPVSETLNTSAEVLNDTEWADAEVINDKTLNVSVEYYREYEYYEDPEPETYWVDINFSAQFTWNEDGVLEDGSIVSPNPGTPVYGVELSEENVDTGDGDVDGEDEDEDQMIPGYNISVFMGVVTMVSVILIMRKKESLKKD
ncbi:MAG: hypothetical protein ACOC35_07890, partial [Promethearchaeia archaeon]